MYLVGGKVSEELMMAGRKRYAERVGKRKRERKRKWREREGQRE